MDLPPLYDPRIPKHKPLIAKFTAILIILMFFVEAIFLVKYGNKGLILLGAKWNEGIRSGEYWRFISCSFLHGNLLHLSFNLLALYILGQELEEYFGKLKFITIYLLSSWGSGLASFIFSEGIAIGASGAIFGIVGCLSGFYYINRKELSGAKLRFKTMYTLVIINILFGLLIPNIDNFAHIGGLFTGIICSIFLTPKYETKFDETLNLTRVVEKKTYLQEFLGIGILVSTLGLLTKIFI